jgi:hypothetical protein
VITDTLFLFLDMKINILSQRLYIYLRIFYNLAKYLDVALWQYYTCKWLILHSRVYLLLHLILHLLIPTKISRFTTLLVPNSTSTPYLGVDNLYLESISAKLSASKV